MNFFVQLLKYINKKNKKEKLKDGSLLEKCNFYFYYLRDIYNYLH